MQAASEEVRLLEQATKIFEAMPHLAAAAVAATGVVGAGAPSVRGRGRPRGGKGGKIASSTAPSAVPAEPPKGPPRLITPALVKAIATAAAASVPAPAPAPAPANAEGAAPAPAPADVAAVQQAADELQQRLSAVLVRAHTLLNPAMVVHDWRDAGVCAPSGAALAQRVRAIALVSREMNRVTYSVLLVAIQVAVSRAGFGGRCGCR